MKNWHATSYSTQPRSRRYGHGVTRSRRKPPRRRCRPTSSLGRSDRPLALLLSSLFACSAKHYSHASWSLRSPCGICCFAPDICSSLPELYGIGGSHRVASAAGSAAARNSRLRAISIAVLTASSSLSVIAEVHAIVAGAKLAQSEPEMARDRFGFLERQGDATGLFGQFCGPLRGMNACRSRLTRASYRSSSIPPGHRARLHGGEKRHTRTQVLLRLDFRFV